jgi:DNA-binding transcriptional ArsR family regulator
LARLGMSEELSVSELAQPFAMSLTAIMKQLEVLSDPRLIVRAKTGRIVACRLTAEKLRRQGRPDHLKRRTTQEPDHETAPSRLPSGMAGRAESASGA